MKFLLLSLVFVSAVSAENLNVTISGDSKEKAELETLSPKPTIPTPEEMTFSLDGGKSAVENEVIPLSVAQAAFHSDLSNFEAPVLPIIPGAPFIVQPIPSERDPALANFRPFGRPQKTKPAITAWEFFVIDDRNREQFRLSGTDLSTAPFVWDGQGKDGLVLQPDESYFPFMIFKSSANLTVRVPGEAERYLCFARRVQADEIILFGERLYNFDQASFSDAGQLYLRDLKHRFALMDPRQPITAEIRFPENKRDLAESRKKTWIEFLESSLDRKIDPKRVTLNETSGDRFLTEVTLKDFKDPTRAIMTGHARDLRPGLEDMKKWIQIKDTGKNVVVEMRHDRLFRSGSAYLRDESLPLIIQAFKDVRAVNQGKEIAQRRTILLRSYMEKPRELGWKKTFEEDPQLAALRSKVLFMLFAEENYLR